MRRFFVAAMGVALALGTAEARADDQTQAVQQALKDQGFYYGQVDGQPGPETDAAIKRYQIRQGLEVTGNLNAQTLSALNLGGGSQNSLEAVPGDQAQQAPAADEATPAPAPKVVESDRDFLKSHAQTPAPAPADEEEAAPAPTPEAVAPTPPPAAAEAPAPGPEEDYEALFRKTPYETAPLVVQRSTVAQAERRLAREGFYRGDYDGVPGEELGRALAAYQRDAGMRMTGRLDMETLSDMDLLPRRHMVLRPFDEGYPGPPPGRDVYRGIWVH